MPPEAGRMRNSFFLMQFASRNLLPLQCVLAIQIEQFVFDVKEGLLFLCHNDVILVPTVIVPLWGFLSDTGETSSIGVAMLQVSSGGRFLLHSLELLPPKAGRSTRPAGLERLRANPARREAWQST